MRCYLARISCLITTGLLSITVSGGGGVLSILFDVLFYDKIKYHRLSQPSIPFSLNILICSLSRLVRLTVPTSRFFSSCCLSDF